MEIDPLVAEQRIRGYIAPTPLVRSRSLSEVCSGNVYLKLENLQTSGSFKARGAVNKILQLSSEEASRGLVTASNGNHALAVATMAARLGIRTEVFVSEHISEVRREQITNLGAHVRFVQGDCLAAEITARREAKQSCRTYVSPYNDAAVVAGQGTIAIEILRQQPMVDAVFVSVGGGGLIGGIGTHLKRYSPATSVAGCWPVNSPALYECLRARAIVGVLEQPTLSTSTAGGIEPDAITFSVAQQVIDRFMLVSEGEILDALRALHRDDHQLVEGAAGVAVAGFRHVADQYRGKNVVILLCGGNVEPTLAQAILGT